MKPFAELPQKTRDFIFARAKGKVIALPEGEDSRIQEAAQHLEKECGAQVRLGTEALAISDQQRTRSFLESQFTKRKKDLPKNIEELSRDVFFDACTALSLKEVDVVVGGVSVPTAHVIRAALATVGLKEGASLITSAFLFNLREPTAGGERIVLYSDCAVVPQPSSEQLAEIAALAANAFSLWTGDTPRIGFLSFSTVGSAAHADVSKVQGAAALFAHRHPSILSEGEVQFDAAVVPNIAARKNPAGTVQGRTNVFVFPDLDAGNIGYKITQRIGGAQAWGPVLLGTALPVSDLSRGASTEDIVHSALLTAALCV